MNLVQLLMNQVNTPENQEKIAGLMGSNQEGAQNALGNIIPMITKALGNQDPNTMENMMDQNMQGQDMASNLFGDKANLIQQFLGKTSNMDQGQSQNFLSQVLPMVMGALGQAKQEQGADTNAFASMLNKSNEEAAQSNSQFGMLTSLLDQDGDGDISDDILNMGKQMLGNFFK